MSMKVQTIIQAFIYESYKGESMILYTLIFFVPLYMYISAMIL